jgi:hypothetical protein
MIFTFFKHTSNGVGLFDPLLACRDIFLFQWLSNMDVARAHWRQGIGVSFFLGTSKKEVTRRLKAKSMLSEMSIYNLTGFPPTRQ